VALSRVRSINGVYLTKKPPIMQDNHPSCSDKYCVLVSEQNVTRASTSWSQFCYYQVNEQWQRSVRARMPELQFISRFVCVPGGHNVILTRHRLRSIAGDGNCLFYTLSYIITGSEEQHYKIQALIISHMLSIPHMLIGIGPDGHTSYAAAMLSYSTIEDYIRCSGMDKDGVWGSAIEMACASHLFNVPLYVYDVSHENDNWIPSYIDRSLPNYMSTYIYFTGNHFNVVSGVRVS